MAVSCLSALQKICGQTDVADVEFRHYQTPIHSCVDDFQEQLASSSIAARISLRRAFASRICVSTSVSFLRKATTISGSVGMAPPVGDRPLRISDSENPRRCAPAINCKVETVGSG